MTRRGLVAATFASAAALARLLLRKAGAPIGGSSRGPRASRESARGPIDGIFVPLVRRPEEKA